ncbi:MAG: alpha/beta hydrolase [Betaproteobacteria bacterium]
MGANAAQIELFPGFAHSTIPVGADGDDISIHCAHGGDGPPVLLLHGYPQTHAIWHKVAQRLAQDYSVVCADLRGYGDSSKPAGAPDHANYSKRAMALDQVQLMDSLGFSRFAVVGHDRGGRAAHRLARDHRDRVTKLCVLDISPTLTMFDQTNLEFARAYYHWFFLIQPSPHPEHMIGLDPKYYLRWKTGGWGSAGHSFFDPRAYAEYERCYCDPAAIHASCEDYRAAAQIDLVHDRADLAEKIDCPVLVLWGERGVVNRCFKPIEDWSAVATKVRGKALPSGHYIAEEVPEALLDELLPFLAGGSG